MIYKYSHGKAILYGLICLIMSAMAFFLAYTNKLPLDNVFSIGNGFAMFLIGMVLIFKRDLFLKSIIVSKDYIEFKGWGKTVRINVSSINQKMRITDRSVIFTDCSTDYVFRFCNYDRGLKNQLVILKSAQQVDSAEASTIAVPPSGPSGSPR